MRTYVHFVHITFFVYMGRIIFALLVQHLLVCCFGDGVADGDDDDDAVDATAAAAALCLSIIVGIKCTRSILLENFVALLFVFGFFSSVLNTIWRADGTKRRKKKRIR